MPIVAMGTILRKGTGGTGTAIASLTEIGGLELSADTIDTTSLDTTNNNGYRTFVTSFKDAGEVSMTGFFDPTHATILTDFEAGTVNAYEIEFTDGTIWGFNACVTGFTTGASLEDLVSFEGTLKVSGKPTLTVAP